MKKRFYFADLVVLMGVSILFAWSCAAASAPPSIAAACESHLFPMQARAPAWLDVEPDLIYTTGHLYLKSVSFDERAIKEMERLDDLVVERLLRSIKKGFVPPNSGPGVVRLPEIHKNLVEVKIVQKSVARLIGCFENGHLTLKRVYHKQGGNSALRKYRDLCD